MARLSFRSVLSVPLALTLATLSGAGTGAPEAHADEGFRCGTGRLVSAGDHMYEVRNKCGEPDAASQRTEKRKVKQKVIRWVRGAAEEITEEREIEVPVDEWIYDLGNRRFTRFVIFENDRVQLVITGEYGSRRRT